MSSRPQLANSKVTWRIGLIRFLNAVDPVNPAEAGPSPEPLFQLGERGFGTEGNHLHLAIRQVRRGAGQTQAHSRAAGERPKPDPLNLAAYQPNPPAGLGHAGLPARAARRARTSSTTIGMTEIRMMAPITRPKLFRTIGRLPK